MTTTIVTRASKGGRLSFTEMDNNLLNLKATADAAAPQSTTYTKTEVNTAITNATPSYSTLTGKPTTVAGYGITNAYVKTEVDSALALKAPLASPSLTGVPVAPTAAANTNTTQLATTAFVVGQAGTAAPIMNGTAAVGTSLLFARQDHVHATDSSRAPLASPALTGTPTAPTAVAGTNTTQVATTAFVHTEVANLVGAAPAALDTLVEIANQLSSDESAAATLTTLVGTKAPLASPTFTGTVSGITATMVGLGNVTNDKQLKDTQTLAIIGDATASATALNTGSISVTLSTSGVTAGTYNNSATALTPITFDAKGRATGTGTAVTITPAFSSITGKPTTLSGYGITDALSSASGNTINGYIAAVTTVNTAINTLSTGVDLGIEARGNGTGPALITLHRPGVHAAYLGLDIDNKLKYGGWTLGANSYEVLHQGNLPTYLTSTALTGTPTAPTATAGTNTTQVATTAFVTGALATAGLPAWLVKTAAYTAVSKDRILANTSAGAFTITLPASPVAGQEVTISDAGGAFGTYNLTIARNGSNIIGQAQDLALDVSNQTVSLAYYNATRGWVITN